jgi:hypothetical protein
LPVLPAPIWRSAAHNRRPGGSHDHCHGTATRAL